MSDTVTQPPSAPPAPSVPEGWKAVWNTQYNEYFYVNLITKKSQWTLPTGPATASDDDAPPPGAPPGYDTKSASAVAPEKDKKLFADAGMSEDEKLARKLQDEENARAGVNSSAGGGGPLDRGESDSYYQQGGPPPMNQQPQYGGGGPGYGSPPPQQQQSDGKRGFLGKLFGKGKSSSSQSQYGQSGPYQQQGGYGGYPPPQQGYYPPQQGYYQPQGQYGQYGQQKPPKKSGLGPGLGAAALGGGAGLLGGALIGSAIAGDHGGGYGGDDGGYGGDDGGCYGGDDGGGYGGDDGGGGDFGGGDF